MPRISQIVRGTIDLQLALPTAEPMCLPAVLPRRRELKAANSLPATLGSRLRGNTAG